MAGIIVGMFVGGLCIGLMFGCVRGPKNIKEYRGELLNTLCDEVIELQSIHAHKDAEINWSELKEAIDNHIETKVKEVIQKKKKILNTIDPYYSKNASDITILEGTRFLKYADDDSKINSLRIKICPVKMIYYIEDSKHNWVFYIEKGYVHATTCAIALSDRNEGKYTFKSRNEAIKAYNEILSYAKHEGRLTNK